MCGQRHKLRRQTSRQTQLNCRFVHVHMETIFMICTDMNEVYTKTRITSYVISICHSAWPSFCTNWILEILWQSFYWWSIKMQFFFDEFCVKINFCEAALRCMDSRSVFNKLKTFHVESLTRPVDNNTNDAFPWALNSLITPSCLQLSSCFCCIFNAKCFNTKTVVNVIHL